MAVRKVRRGLLEVGFGVVGSKTFMLVSVNGNGNGTALAMLGWEMRSSWCVIDRLVRSHGIEMG